MIHKFFRILLISALCFTLLVGCNQSLSKSESNKIQVTTTTGMIADIVKNVGGTHTEVSALMGTGVDPHLYKASQGDIRKLDQSHLIFYNGLHLEGKMTDVLSKIGKNKPVTAISDKIDRAKLLEIGANLHDPHIWFDVQLWMSATEVVRDTLIKQDPSHKADYEKQAADYLAKLKQLDEDVKKQVNSVPKEQRVLVTAHDAFSYFGKAYGIEVVGLQGISTAAEYGLKDVQNMVDLISKRKIKAVFVESSVPKKSIEAVVEGSKQKGHEVKIGGELYSDAMGKAGTPEGTYIGMVQANVAKIVNSLK
ncbi:manganese/zinc/iron transport system substrate-binding protein [Thermoactinomyces sp. DSM 45891]|uniref:metal ABC transporter solute-binding protein, Zn/Mn family n=1 Tax=Thermoactinomyces sp. DSM 45891 TaxID=1761907 RepID=UPI000914973D|nr:zinc ABC transporter substrate-binding protein [Thermoactinomyces sp. DSM 45891]SFX08821.1 manganese/zinc/iron transport system substrate-binding protein [Thermoactinomyces sp. DSM 45891]